MSVFNLVLTVAAALFGLCEIGYGFYAYRLNGYGFYCLAGILIGLPFLLIAGVTLLAPGRQFGGWEFLFFALWALGVSWKAWMKRRARQADPESWAHWQEILDGKR